MGSAPEMYERIRPSLTILSRSPDTFEAEMFVKAEGLRVLRVHIDRQVWMRGKSLMNKGLANTSAMLIRVHKKRLQMPFMQEHEAERRIRTINGKTQRDLREKA